MAGSLKVFVPKSIAGNPQNLARAVANALDGAAKGALVDFKVTTQTWQHKVAFDIQEPSADRRVVGTDDDIYNYVSGGTKPHVIVAHGKALAFPGGGFRPKSQVKVIGSSAGGAGGAVIFRPRVNHPGSAPREFEETIAEKWRKELPVTMQRTIDSEVT